MFDEDDFSTGGTCTGHYCPVPPEQLDKLFGQDDELQPSDQDCLIVSNAIALNQFRRQCSGNL